MSTQLGVTVTSVVPPTPTYDPWVEVSTIDSLAAKGYNAFAVFPDGESAIKPTYQRLAPVPGRARSRLYWNNSYQCRS